MPLITSLHAVISTDLSHSRTSLLQCCSITHFVIFKEDLTGSGVYQISFVYVPSSKRNFTDYRWKLSQHQKKLKNLFCVISLRDLLFNQWWYLILSTIKVYLPTDYFVFVTFRISISSWITQNHLDGGVSVWTSKNAWNVKRGVGLFLSNAFVMFCVCKAFKICTLIPFILMWWKLNSQLSFKNISFNLSI